MGQLKFPYPLPTIFNNVNVKKPLEDRERKYKNGKRKQETVMLHYRKYWVRFIKLLDGGKPCQGICT